MFFISWFVPIAFIFCYGCYISLRLAILSLSCLAVHSKCYGSDCRLWLTKTVFLSNNSKKSGKVKTAYKREFVNLGCDVDFDFAGPTIHGAAVVGYEGWLAGYQMTFDTAKSKMTQNNFAVGYKTGDFQLHTNV